VTVRIIADGLYTRDFVAPELARVEFDDLNRDERSIVSSRSATSATSFDG